MKKGRSAWLLLIDDQDRVLIIKRSEQVNNPGQWGFPGGSHKNMKYKKLIKRETFEEVGLKLKPTSIFKKKHNGRVHRYYMKRFDHTEHIITLNYEASEYKFIHMSKLEKLKNPHRSIKYLML